MSDATDAAVKLAAEHELDLADVVGTGADGRVTKSDVEAYLASREAADTAVMPDVAPAGTPEAAGEPETAVAPDFLAEVQTADSLQTLIALGSQAADEAQRAAVRARAKELLEK